MASFLLDCSRSCPKRTFCSQVGLVYRASFLYVRLARVASVAATCRSNNSPSNCTACAPLFKDRHRSAAICRTLSFCGSLSRICRYSAKASAVLPFCNSFSAFSMRRANSARLGFSGMGRSLELDRGFRLDSRFHPQHQQRASQAPRLRKSCGNQRLERRRYSCSPAAAVPDPEFTEVKLPKCFRSRPIGRAAGEFFPLNRRFWYTRAISTELSNARFIEERRIRQSRGRQFRVRPAASTHGRTNGHGRCRRLDRNGAAPWYRLRHRIGRSGRDPQLRPRGLYQLDGRACPRRTCQHSSGRRFLWRLRRSLPQPLRRIYLPRRILAPPPPRPPPSGGRGRP